MADTVARSLSQISNEIRQLTAETKKSVTEVRNLNGAIKIDSGNVEAVRKRFAELAKQVDINNQKVAAYKQKQNLLKAELDSGAITEKKYYSELQKTNTAIEKAKKNTEELTTALKKQNQEITAAKFDKINNGLANFKTSAEKAAKAAKGIITAIAGATIAFGKFVDELGDTAQKMRVSVQELQIGRGLFENYAEGADGYDQALKALSSTMSSVAKGRGAAYIDTLNKIGLAQQDLVGKDTATQLDMVMEALRGIPDEASRVETAMILMGDAGRNVATIANLTAEEVNTYKQALADAGLITEEQTVAADTLGNTMALVKQQLMVQTAELITNAMPAIVAFIDLLKILIDIIGYIGRGLQILGPDGTKILFIIITLVAVLPKLIGIIQAIVGVVKILRVATIGQAIATGALTTAAGPLLIVLMAIAAIVLLLIGLFNKLTGAQDEATNSLAKYQSGMDDFQKNQSAANYGIEQYTELSTAGESTVTENYSYGDSNTSINVYVTEPAATPAEIAQAVSKELAIKFATRR